MMLEEDLKSFEAMVGFALFCIAVMFGEWILFLIRMDI